MFKRKIGLKSLKSIRRGFIKMRVKVKKKSAEIEAMLAQRLETESIKRRRALKENPRT